MVIYMLEVTETRATCPYRLNDVHNPHRRTIRNLEEGLLPFIQVPCGSSLQSCSEEGTTGPKPHTSFEILNVVFAQTGLCSCLLAVPVFFPL